MTIALFLFIGAVLLLVAPATARAYAETHYRIAPGVSRLFRPEPEVYWDCPWRVTRGETLPLALLVKDAHRFPITIESLDIRLKSDSGEFRLEPDAHFQTDLRFPVLIRHPFYYTIIEIALPDDIAGDVTIAPRMRVKFGDKQREIGVSSHPAFSDAPLNVYVAESGLPTLPGWTYAETHTHSWHTSDQIEFGAPPEMLSRLAKTIGLDWVFVTDHSFDLTTPLGRWFGDDPESSRWQTLEREIKEVNSARVGAHLIRGEEVSCGSDGGKNLHLLVYGCPELIPGKGDAAKKWFVWRNSPDMPLAEALKIARQHGALAFAAHPMQEPSFAERFVLNRGGWKGDDIAQELDGLEIWNTDLAEPLVEARERWIALLLRGYRKPVIAGSDAHGDFNRARCVTVPFVKVEECFEEGFGKPRTAIYTPDGTEEDAFNALRTGKTVMTNGPMVAFEVSAEGTAPATLGETIEAQDLIVRAHAVSTEEFGEIERVVLYVGEIGSEAESALVLGENVGYDREIVGRISLTESSYLRIEAEAARGRAITNPIWVEPPIMGV